MKRIAISIVLNGEPHLSRQIARNYSNGNFDGLSSHFDRWIFVEGASKNSFCTSWCKDIPDLYHKDGHSVDGTLQHLELLSTIPETKVKLITTDGLWDGKVSMFNAALATIQEPCWLWQIDIDEYWEPKQLEHAETILENTGCDEGAFACDYMLSDDIVVRGNWGESITHGYRRLFKYTPGSKFLAHEPPVLENTFRLVPPALLPRFRHLSYYYEKDVLFKSKWYGGHENIHQGWKNIVEGKTKLPCRVEHLFMKDVSSDWKDTIITYR